MTSLFDAHHGGMCYSTEYCVSLRKLGFRINWDKVVGHVQSITFLGIQIDTKSMTKCLPQEKLLALRLDLQAFSKRK